MQIPYNNAGAYLRLEFPHSWRISDDEGFEANSVTVTVTDMSNTELQSAASATIYTQDQTAAAVSRGGEYIPLDSGPGSGYVPEPGDRFWITPHETAPSSPAEFVECSSYDATNKYIYLAEDLKHDHVAGSNVKGLFAIYYLDTTDTDTYPKGKRVVITWTPDSGGVPVQQVGEIAAFAFDMSDFEGQFRTDYPLEYEAATTSGSLSNFYVRVRERLRIKLLSRGFLLDRLVDQSITTAALVDLARLRITARGGDKWANEYEIAAKEYGDSFEALCRQPVWIDMDQDQVEDEDEIDDYSAEQLLGSEGAI